MTADQIRWHFYISRPNELFIDADSPSRLFFSMRRLERNRARLSITDVFVYPSGTANHYHLFATLDNDLEPIERAVWAQHCGSDRARAEYILMRINRGLRFGDFLITPHPYDFRKPDRACACADKHKDRSITDACPVMQNLLGAERSAEYFEREPKATFKFGKVTLEEILKEDTRWKK